MANKPRKYDDDDGRVICSMDVEGMRWHDKRVRRENREAQRPLTSNQMTRSEARQFTWYAMLGGLLIAAVFSVTWVLFILFCTEIWFK
jgi:hypothetical protein